MGEIGETEGRRDRAGDIGAERQRGVLRTGAEARGSTIADTVSTGCRRG